MGIKRIPDIFTFIMHYAWVAYLLNHTSLKYHDIYSRLIQLTIAFVAVNAEKFLARWIEKSFTEVFEVVNNAMFS